MCAAAPRTIGPSRRLAQFPSCGAHPQAPHADLSPSTPSLQTGGLTLPPPLPASALPAPSCPRFQRADPAKSTEGEGCWGVNGLLKPPLCLCPQEQAEAAAAYPECRDRFCIPILLLLLLLLLRGRGWSAAVLLLLAYLLLSLSPSSSQHRRSHLLADPAPPCTSPPLPYPRSPYTPRSPTLGALARPVACLIPLMILRPGPEPCSSPPPRRCSRRRLYPQRPCQSQSHRCLSHPHLLARQAGSCNLALLHLLDGCLCSSSRCACYSSLSLAMLRRHLLHQTRRPS